MSITPDRTLGTFLVECDEAGCSEYYEHPDDDWHEMIEQIKRDGWKIGKEGGEWTHTCKSCVEEQEEMML